MCHPQFLPDAQAQQRGRKLIATVHAGTDKEAIEKAMAEIKEVFPVDTLWPEDGWGWYWDDDDEAEVVWLED